MFNNVLELDNNSTIIELRGLGTYLVSLNQYGTLNVFSSDDSNNIQTCNWVHEGQLVTEKNIQSYYVSVFDGNNLVLMYTTKSGLSKVAIWPGDFPLYGNSDPYRLYYGIDSETLYMNVENRWVPISYLSHDKMHDVGTLTHEQLESALVGALERIASLEAVPPGSSEIKYTKEEW